MRSSTCTRCFVEPSTKTRAVCEPVSSSSAEPAEASAPVVGSSGSPRLEVCETVPDNAATFSPAARASTWAGVFVGRFTPALAARGTATATDAIRTGTTMAGSHLTQVRDMLRPFASAVAHAALCHLLKILRVSYCSLHIAVIAPRFRQRAGPPGMTLVTVSGSSSLTHRIRWRRLPGRLADWSNALGSALSLSQSLSLSQWRCL